MSAQSHSSICFACPTLYDCKNSRAITSVEPWSEVEVPILNNDDNNNEKEGRVSPKGHYAFSRAAWNTSATDTLLWCVVSPARESVHVNRNVLHSNSDCAQARIRALTGAIPVPEITTILCTTEHALHGRNLIRIWLVNKKEANSYVPKQFQQFQMQNNIEIFLAKTNQ